MHHPTLRAIREIADLADCSATVFEGIHAEVAGLAARTETLDRRCRQLAPLVPIVEGAFYKETDALAATASGGVEWHANGKAVQVDIRLTLG